MAFRVNRAIRIAPGVSFRVNKRSVGLSFGGRGVHSTVNTRGRRTASVGIPGTGMYWQESTAAALPGCRPTRTSTSRRAPASGTVTGTPAEVVTRLLGSRRPGVFAGRGERALHRAARAGDTAALAAVADEHPEVARPAHLLAALLAPEDAPAVAVAAHLRAVLAGGADPTADRFLARYLPHLAITLTVAPGIDAAVPVDRDAVGLLLAEVLQHDGDLDEAIEVAEGLAPTTLTAVSLAELYLQRSRFHDVVELTDGLEVTDDATALLTVYRGIALRELGHLDASRDALTTALRSRHRAAEIRHLALASRAATALARGHRADARRDLERILAEDSDYPGLREELAELSSPSAPD